MDDRTLTAPQPRILLPADLPTAIKTALAELQRPFRSAEVELLPGAVNHDGTSALALPYAGWWTSYVPRLNHVIGQWNWSIRLEPWGSKLIAHFTAFDGLIQHSSTGESDGGHENEGTSSEAQAKKRACAEAVGLGLFFYFLPKVWARGERQGKAFRFAPGERERAVEDMFRLAGLTQRRHVPAGPATVDPPAEQVHGAAAPATPPHAPAPHPAPVAGHPVTVAPSNPRAAAAREVLVQAEAQARPPIIRRPQPVRLAPRDTPAPPTPDGASDKQLGLIARLVHEVLDANAEFTVEIDALGQVLAISHLSRCQSVAALRATPLTKRDAMHLIDELKLMGSTITDATSV